jgi:hypothetical protein
MHGLLAFLMIFSGASDPPVVAVPVSLYGDYPNDGLDDTVAINEAIVAKPGFWQVADPTNRIMKLENSAGLDITGVRWDGFVAHAPYGMITNVTSATDFVISMVAGTSGQTIYAGSKLRFLDAAGAITERIVGSNAVHQLINGQSCYSIVLTEPLPAFAGAGTYLKVEDISPDSVTVTDSNFENIAG